MIPATTIKKRREAKKKRLFKVLDSDPALTSPQIVERFGLSINTAIRYRAEWRRLRERKA